MARERLIEISVREREIGITPKAIVIAFALVIGISVAGCFSAYLRYDLIGTGHLPRCALFPIMMLMLFNSLCKRLLGRIVLSRSELLFIYCTILIMTGIPGQQYADYLYLGLLAPVYYSHPRNMPELLQYDVPSWLAYIPNWFLPSKDPRSGVIAWAFEGMPEGAKIPWQPWVIPLMVWTAFYVALFYTAVGIAVLLRKQWIENEKLVFPLAQVPIEVADERRVGALIRNPMMWACFFIPTFIYSVRALHIYFPSFPGINIYRNFGVLFSGRPWDVLNYLPLNYYFDMIGITYLITTDVGFSFWFFYIVRRMQMVARAALGLTDFYVPLEFQTIGGLLTLFGMQAWVARGYLKSLVTKALHPEADDERGQKMISPRTTLLIISIGLVVLLLFAVAINLSLHWAILLFAIHFIWRTLVARMVAEAGLFVFWTPSPHTFIVRAFGKDAIGPKNITGLNMIGSKLSDSATCVLAQAIQAMKIAHAARLSELQVLKLIMLSLLTSILACHPTCVYILYTTPIPKMGWWTRGYPAGMARTLLNQLVQNQKMTTGNYISLISGGIVTIALCMLRWRFLWWPFHPLGYVAVNGTWFGDRYGFSIFLGWVIKALTLWFGGIRMWQMLRPAAMGLILGNTFILFLLLLLHFFKPTNEVVVIE
ncbi:MAG: DUF6785 family protein [Armatimonadota bacterium]|nr:hypothetical protein [Armatimonadota bacterium]MCX7778458.1 hypothetical protein [Armatimonadota bacterium]MDW8026521.1 DUF6785 family protein [Armatimonadota bacterium]